VAFPARQAPEVGVDRQYSSLTQHRRGIEKLLGDLEREIMEIMWARPQGSVRDLLVAINQERPADRKLAYTTVMTVMARLADKKLLERQLVGRTHAYAAAQTREAFLARSSQDFARQMIEDFGDAAVAGFLNVLRDVAPDRLAKLRRQARRRGPT
jgi:predicted transcriptional regulator